MMTQEQVAEVKRMMAALRHIEEELADDTTEQTQRINAIIRSALGEE